MVVLEIIMVLVGIGAVFLSFRISGNNNSAPAGGGITKEELEEMLKKIENANKKYNTDIQVKAEEAIDSTDNKLGQILNEKIMGLSEYSQQILEKMEKNHSETVFLYDMLNEKEKEIKDLVHDADITRADIRDEIAMQYQELKRRLEEADEVKKGLELETLGGTRNVSRQEQRFYTVPEGTGEVLDMAGFNSGINLSSEITENGLMKELDMQNSSVEDNTTEIENDVTVNNNAAEPETDKPYISLAGQENANIDNYGYKLYGNFGVTEIDKAMLETEINNTNHNDEIIELYKKGRSILEISKMLSIGQGEVKFVIDMYKAS